MRIAIVGTGISGLVCARLLYRAHDLSLFEANDWIGGHTHTVPVALGDRVVSVDTGFIVYNERNYPQFTRLLARLGVATQPTDMSFSVRCDRTGLEYRAPDLGGLFAQRRNLLRPSFLAMLREVLRFQGDARRLLASGDTKVTLGDFLAGRGYSDDFVDRHLVPMGAAIWSADPAQMRAFPALTFARFFDNHGLLQLRGRPTWRVVRGGSGSYVERLVEPFRERIRTSCPVRAVRRDTGGVEVVTDDGVDRFDHVILATHGDQALALLEDPTRDERRVLGAIRTQENEVVLHTDASLLPACRRASASWNVRVPAEERGRVAVTYHMNRLQGLDTPVELCVTLNDTGSIDPTQVLGSWTAHHPIFDAPAVEAQRHRRAISGVDRTHYCGAYWGYGFHEDGVRSALAVASDLRRLDEGR